MHDKPHWSNFQFDLTQAIFHLPDVVQKTAHTVWKDKMAKKKAKAKGEGYGDEADEIQGKEQLPSMVDWPGAGDPLPLGEEENDEE